MHDVPIARSHPHFLTESLDGIDLLLGLNFRLDDFLRRGYLFGCGRVLRVGRLVRDGLRLLHDLRLGLRFGFVDEDVVGGQRRFSELDRRFGGNARAVVR